MHGIQIAPQSHLTLSPKGRTSLFIGIAILFFTRLILLFLIPFTDTTEARYAEIARKMVETNDWITPQFDYGIPFWGKPPLHTWISAIGMKFFGVNTFGARIGMFLTTILLLFLLYQWAKRMKGPDFALAGIFIISGSLLFLLSSATVMTDMVMTLGTTLCMISFWDMLHHKQVSRLSKYLFFVGLAIGLLAKGPVATVLSALPIGLWVLLTNNWINTWKKIPWLSGLALTSLLVIPWYYLAEMKTPGFLDYFIIGEHYQRFVNSAWKGDRYGHGHAHTRGTIWRYALTTFLPWTPFLLWPLLRFKKITSAVRKDQNELTLYLLCWALAPMLFFTLATNILPTYVLPAIPALGFLALDLYLKAHAPSPLTPRTLGRWFTITGSISTILAITACAIIIIKPHVLEHRTQKFLIQDVEHINTQSSLARGDLYYWHHRFYSAEFYSSGKSKTIKKLEELTPLFENPQLDFLVIRERDLHEIPASILTKFKKLKSYRKDVVLYRETPPSSN